MKARSFRVSYGRVSEKCNPSIWVTCLYHAFRPSLAFDLTSTLRLWLHRRISPDFPATSSSESSSLEEQTRGKHRFSNESATQPKVLRSTVLINREFANRYDLVLIGASDLSSSS
jgi:hypothetical protein